MLDRSPGVQVVQVAAVRVLLLGPQVRVALHLLLVRVTLVAQGLLALPLHQTVAVAAALGLLALRD
jgi:hypothetical protein